MRAVSNDADLLQKLLGRAWRKLEAGADSATSPCHLGTLVTVSTDGRPEARTVVLREADAQRRRLVCHTDARSPKADQIRANPVVAWLFYDATERVQLRLWGTARLHSDGPLADRRWESSSAASRRCYLAPRAPGAACDSPSANLPEDLRHRAPTLDESLAGRGNFIAIETRIEELEWLELHSTGHLRALFRFGAGSVDCRWLEP